MNATIEKFGYPATLLREYDHWAVLLRPAQVTAGSLVLAAKGDERAFADLATDAFTELATVVRDVETLLQFVADFERINYLMLMMVDPHVHFHVFPRYQGVRNLVGLELADHGWPGPPDLKSAITFDCAALDEAVSLLKGAWK